jgi:sulfite reductase (ferredoxin)
MPSKPTLPPQLNTRKPAVPPLAKKPGLPPAKLPPGANGGAVKGEKGKSSTEAIKENSDGLRGQLVEELARNTDHFEGAEMQLLKFHGIYQQDDRDSRQGAKEYIFMVRSRLPGGKLTAEQYLVHEAIADTFGNGTLRITTRQGFQFHGIVKGNLKASMKTLNESLITTLAACGDVVRNVICTPSPVVSDIQRQIDALSQELADYFLPRSGAYHEVWVDGEKVYNGQEHVETIEPIYGKAYLPRKFKIGIASPGDNSIDVYTNDVGLIAVVDGDSLLGFNVVVGGGLGMTHKKADTFPRLADELAFVTVAETVPVVEEIIKIQRDHGDRTNRKHARLKYLIADWGIARFRAELEKRLGYAVKNPVPVPELELNLFLGWQEQGDGKWFLGLSVENGRIADTEERKLKAGLHEIVARFRPGVRLTTNQDLLLTDVAPEDRPLIDEILSAYDIRHEHELSNARKFSMACPAMPTCGLAIAESERVMPALIDELEAELARLGLEDEKLSVRMTGCPNGCARPYVADIGLVGRSLDRYTVFLGGRMDGTRLNWQYKDLVPLTEIVSTVRPLFVHFKQERVPGEAFGDFCQRVGLDALHQFAESHTEHAVVI